ncbi:MAG: hypothetical protein WDN47_01290 [Candidatus Doudnabacteria bacterium]
MTGPKFELCNTCRKHGRIVGADGFYSCEVWSQVYGRYMVEVGIQQDTLKSTDAHELFRQIKQSGLPLRDEDVDEATRQLVIKWNMARAQMPNQNTNPDEIHFTLEMAEKLVRELRTMGPGLKIIDLRNYKPQRQKSN